MEAGYDYLLIRRQLSNAFLRYSGYFLLAVGALLLVTSIGYFSYTWWGRSQLSGLNYAVSPITAKTQAISGSVAMVAPASASPATIAPKPLSSAQGELAKARGTAGGPLRLDAIADVEELSPRISATLIAQQSLYPGEILRASAWSNPFAYEPTSYVETLILGEFKPVDLTNLPPQGTVAPPTHITIPSIDVNSKIEALNILNLGDSRAYETPKDTVGHIPQTFNAGESGSAWFFGHLESPIMDEGAVFYNLPKIPGLLRKGDDVHVIVGNGTRAYLYKITEAIVVNQDDLQLDYQSLKELKPQYALLKPGGANIHLVACVPRLDYSRRLVVSGTLVGIQ